MTQGINLLSLSLRQIAFGIGIAIISVAAIVGFASYSVGYSQGARLGEVTVTVTSTTTTTLKDPITVQGGLYLDPFSALVITIPFVVLALVALKGGR